MWQSFAVWIFGISKNMTFTAVLLFCTAGIAVCAAFVFLVETIVAFWLHDREDLPAVPSKVITLASRHESSRDKAA